jgi:hypothetical protein
MCLCLCIFIFLYSNEIALKRTLKVVEKHLLHNDIIINILMYFPSILVAFLFLRCQKIEIKLDGNPSHNELGKKKLCSFFRNTN